MTGSEVHFTAELAEEYVTGALEGSRAAQLEAHASICPACGALLAKEARLECKLSEAAHALESPNARVLPLWRRVPGFVPVVAALAAGLAAFLFWRGHESRGELGTTPDPINSAEIAARSQPPPPFEPRIEAPISAPAEELAMVVVAVPSKGDLP